MSHSIIVPPVHDTSPPPLDDDIDDHENDDDFISPPAAVPFEEEQTSPIDIRRENSSTNDNNDDWQSVDENQDNPVTTAPIDDDSEPTTNENPVVELKQDEDVGWADFAAFETKMDDAPEPALTEASNTNKNEDEADEDWACFASASLPSADPAPVVENKNEEEEDDDDFGEFSEVQVSSEAPPPPPPPPPPAPVPIPTPSLPIENLNSEKIESLIATCFPMDASTSSMANSASVFPSLPSFSTLKSEEQPADYLESSIALWRVLSNLSNDPLGITFQWRKSNTERLFHQALGVNERFRAKAVPLTPEILQPEKVKPNTATASAGSEQQSTSPETKIPSPTIRPHFDWKQSGLENPLADTEISYLPSNLSKNEETSNVFDANKTLDLDFYVPPIKSGPELERSASPATSLSNESSIVPTQRSSIPIKTMDLFPGSTTTLNDDTKRILDSLPNLSFMSAKALMFPVRFNGTNHDESTSLF